LHHFKWRASLEEHGMVTIERYADEEFWYPSGREAFIVCIGSAVYEDEDDYQTILRPGVPQYDSMSRSFSAAGRALSSYRAATQAIADRLIVRL